MSWFPLVHPAAESEFDDINHDHPYQAGSVTLLPKYMFGQKGVVRTLILRSRWVQNPSLSASEARSPQSAASKASAASSPVVPPSEPKLPGGIPADNHSLLPSSKGRELTDFQQFVARSLGYPLPIHGAARFDNAPATFAPVDRIPVAADYVVGPGDELLIRAWGQIDAVPFLFIAILVRKALRRRQQGPPGEAACIAQLNRCLRSST
jgi:hypothetical protein